jgi:hypothetical protein
MRSFKDDGLDWYLRIATANSQVGVEIEVRWAMKQAPLFALMPCPCDLLVKLGSESETVRVLLVLSLKRSTIPQ